MRGLYRKGEGVHCLRLGTRLQPEPRTRSSKVENNVEKHPY